MGNGILEVLAGKVKEFLECRLLSEKSVEITSTVDDSNDLDPIAGRSKADYVFADTPESQILHEVIATRTQHRISCERPTGVFKSLNMAKSSSWTICGDKLQYLKQIAPRGRRKKRATHEPSSSSFAARCRNSEKTTSTSMRSPRSSSSQPRCR